MKNPKPSKSHSNNFENLGLERKPSNISEGY